MIKETARHNRAHYSSSSRVGAQTMAVVGDNVVPDGYRQCTADRWQVFDSMSWGQRIKWWHQSNEDGRLDKKWDEYTRRDDKKKLRAAWEQQQRLHPDDPFFAEKQMIEKAEPARKRLAIAREARKEKVGVSRYFSRARIRCLVAGVQQWVKENRGNDE